MIQTMAGGSIREINDLGTKIANLGPPAIRPLIHGARKGTLPVRLECMRTLAMMGASPALPALGLLVDDPHPKVREAADRAVVTIRRKRADYLARHGEPESG